MNDLFYVFGLALTAAALIVSFVGLRMEKFPQSRGLMLGVIGLFLFLVVGSAAYGVSLAREEHKHPEEAIAAYREEQAAEVEEAEEPVTEEPTDEEPVQGGTLALTSPEAGDLVFEPETLEAEAGEV